MGVDTRLRRELDALVGDVHEPTAALRTKVRLFAFNQTPVHTIARILDIPVMVLRYHYWRELEMTEHEVLAMCAGNLFALANQTQDLGVSLRANLSILSARSAVWREPKAVDPEGTTPALRADRLTLEQVEAELARLDMERGAHPDPQPRPDDPPGPRRPR